MYKTIILLFLSYVMFVSCRNTKEASNPMIVIQSGDKVYKTKSNVIRINNKPSLFHYDHICLHLDVPVEYYYDSIAFYPKHSNMDYTTNIQGDNWKLIVLEDKDNLNEILLNNMVHRKIAIDSINEIYKILENDYFNIYGNEEEIKHEKFLLDSISFFNIGSHQAVLINGETDRYKKNYLIVKLEKNFVIAKIFSDKFKENIINGSYILRRFRKSNSSLNCRDFIRFTIDNSGFERKVKPEEVRLESDKYYLKNQTHTVYIYEKYYSTNTFLELTKETRPEEFLYDSSKTINGDDSITRYGVGTTNSKKGFLYQKIVRINKNTAAVMIGIALKDFDKALIEFEKKAKTIRAI